MPVPILTEYRLESDRDPTELHQADAVSGGGATPALALHELCPVGNSNTDPGEKAKGELFGFGQGVQGGGQVSHIIEDKTERVSGYGPHTPVRRVCCVDQKEGNTH